MNLFGAMEASGSALEAERIRAEVVAANMANAETTRTADGGPYRRQHVVFTSTAPPQSFAGQLMAQSEGSGGEFGGVRVSAEAPCGVMTRVIRMRTRMAMFPIRISIL